MSSYSDDVKSKKVFLQTWGCQMNVADGENMLALLKQNHFETTTSANEADLIVLNTCHIREKARHKVISELGKLKPLKEKNKNLRIAVTGCVAQAEGKSLLGKDYGIDILMGPGRISQLPDLVKEAENSAEPKAALGFDRHRSAEFKDLDALDHNAKPPLSGMNEISRYINIMQGCNNYCTFCVVPFTRGAEVSRDPQSILQEVRAMIARGAKEITLLGQNVNSYGQDLVSANFLSATKDGPFVDLLRQVAALPGLESLRFTTSNPHDFTKPLAQLYEEYPVLGRHLHLAVQSGSNLVLERMKRKVTVEEFRERVGWLRSFDPEFSLSTDIIVGFPGETEEDFEATLDLVRETRFSFVFAFSYSARKHTPAARYTDHVPESVKKERLQRLLDLQNQITTEINEAEVGRVRDVMFHYESRKQPGLFYGRSTHFKLVGIKADRSIVGKMMPTMITGANKTALMGQVSTQ